MKRDLHTKLAKATKHWVDVTKIIYVPHNKNEYNELVAILNRLLDMGGRNEHHPLASLANIIGNNLEIYESSQSFPFKKSLSAVAALKLIMQEHQLKQTDLTEIGSQSVVSAILNGKRKLNTRQIKGLSARFKLEPGFFLN